MPSTASQDQTSRRTSADEDLAFAGVARLGELLGAGQVTPRELAEFFLARIERLNPTLRAFISVRAERALEEADAALKRLQDGERGPLLGMPIAVKDNVDVAGEVTTHGAGRSPRAGDRRLRGRPAPARRRRGDPRQDRAVRAGCLRTLHELHRARCDAQPVEPRALARRLLRRQRRSRGRGHGAGRARFGRRRLDPDPVSLLRALRPQAPARPRVPRPARGPLVRVHRPRRHRTQRPRRRHLRRRDQRRTELQVRARPLARRRGLSRTATPPHCRFAETGDPTASSHRRSRSPRSSRSPGCCSHWGTWSKRTNSRTLSC